MQTRVLTHIATDVEGIFRLSGSAKRIKELQAQFDSPERYGKGLDWTGYTVHDAANILRRYLNQLPQPIVPLEFYERFRDPLRHHQAQAVGDTEAMAQEVPTFDHDKAIHTYQQLITELPSLNRQLLLYILDLLAVFAAKSDVNLMTSANLAAIFQPGLLSHPNHDMSPQEYRLSQDVLIFLIDNQDSFLFGMSGTAVDEKTAKEVQSGAAPRQQTSTAKATQAALGRSASNASAGADSLRRLSGIRRNVSVSSRGSKHSSGQGPATPSSGVFTSGGGGVHRSNTVPSKKSPALSSTRFARGMDSPNTPVALSPGLVSSSARSTSPAKGSLKVPEVRDPSPQTSSPNPERPPAGVTTASFASEASGQSREFLLPNEGAVTSGSKGNSPHLRPVQKTRKVSDILSKSLASTTSDKEQRQPNKLRKKRVPSGIHPSAHSSTNSLTGAEDSPSDANFRTPMMTPGASTTAQSDPMLGAAAQAPENFNKVAEAVAKIKPESKTPQTPPKLQDTQQASETTLKAKSPPRSVHSKSSVTDLSEHDQNDENRHEKAGKRSRWNLSSKKDGSGPRSHSPARFGTNPVAEKSTSSIGSWHKSLKSVSNDAPGDTNEPVPAIPPQHVNTDGSKSKDSDEHQDSSGEKKGFFKKMIAKVSHAQDERKERESEKERAKSPSRDTDRSGSKHSLSAVANDTLPIRGRSMDVSRETIPEAAAEKND